MLAHIPPKLKRWLVFVSVPCACVVTAYFLLPHFGLSHYVEGKNWFMAAGIAATIPPLVFKVAHLPVHQDQAVNKRVESLFSLGLLGWIFAFGSFSAGYYIIGAVLLAIAILLIVRAHLKWVTAFLTAMGNAEKERYTSS